MSKIKIKNFGAIQEGLLENKGWIDIDKVTVFIGNQGSGKSTVAKLISTFTWIEKALVRGDYDLKWFEGNNKFVTDCLAYHRLDTYLSKNTELAYIGDVFSIEYENGILKIYEMINKRYELPQIMYVPAERNFISYVKNPKELKLSSDSLQEFLTEFNKAKENIIGEIDLPINMAQLEYDEVKDELNIHGDTYKIALTDSSSGFQSLVPLYIVSKYLSEIVEDRMRNNERMSLEQSKRFKEEFREIQDNNIFTNEQKRLAISELASKFNKTSFINIVEEPEQNLYPTSQFELLKSLIKYNNSSVGNKLVLTTHSPYIINYLSILIQGGILKNKLKSKSKSVDRLNALLPLNSLVNQKGISIYELDENTGVISKLNDYEGIPSDNNLLNQSLNEGNLIFDQLLEIEQEVLWW